MSAATMPRCPSGRCPTRRVPSPSVRGARATAFALAVLALLLMLNGEAWLLQRTADAPDELAVATCAFAAVDLSSGLMPACTQSTPMDADKGTL